MLLSLGSAASAAAVALLLAGEASDRLPAGAQPLLYEAPGEGVQRRRSLAIGVKPILIALHSLISKNNWYQI